MIRNALRIALVPWAIVFAAHALTSMCYAMGMFFLALAPYWALSIYDETWIHTAKRAIARIGDSTHRRHG